MTSDRYSNCKGGVLGRAGFACPENFYVGQMHGFGLTPHTEQISDQVLRVEEASLYPALDRMKQEGWVAAEWRFTENNRRAR